MPGVVITEFPAKPQDKTIYQSRQGLVFIYERASNAWIRVTSGGAFQLATPVSDGLMAAVDLKKINRLYVPLPRATLTSDQCQGRFSAGNIDLFSLDDYVRITGWADLHNAGRLLAPLPHKYRISLHTSGFDFGINKDNLIKYLINHNQLILAGPPGPKGRKGPRGAPGNQLPTGAKGPKGDPGQAPACQYSINQDSLNYQSVPGANKAIVNIATRQVSSTEYVVVLQQGAIGNPNISPDQLQVNCGDNSTWVLAATASSGTITPLFYLDLFPIVETIKTKYEDELQRLKAGHERIVQFWLSKLMGLFDSEKSALCCALFNCLKTIARIPQPVSGITTAALQPGMVITRGFENLPAGHPLANIALPGTLASAAARTDLISGDIMLTVTASNLGGEGQAVSVELSAGRYRAIIDDCCLRVGQQYTGDVKLIYNFNGTKRITQFPRVGYFTQPRLAANAYDGLSLDINHAGGPVGAYYPAGPDIIASSQSAADQGHVRIRFVKQQEVLLDRTCLLTEAQLGLFERVWNALKSGGSGCGLVTRIAGQDYILVAPSESTITHNVDCVAKFGNVTIAWPTLDGEHFLPAGPGPYTFKLDKSLNDLVAANLAEGLYEHARGCESVARVEGNVWVSKSIKQVILDSFVTVLFPIG
jgi:hypothetical protein